MSNKLIIYYCWLMGIATVMYKDRIIHVCAGPNFNKDLEKAKDEILRF